MKKYFKILGTNWINITGLFITVFIYSVIYSYIDSSFTLIQSLLSSLILVGLYGLLFWAGFIIIIIVLDLIFIVNFKNNLKQKLILEWLIISIPFFYWTIKYKQWIFLIAIITFFITQMIRKKQILKIK